MTTLLDMAKLVSAAIAGMVFLASLYSGFVGLVGGRIVPWATPDEVRRIVAENIKGLQAESDQRECKDYKDRLGRAVAALMRNADDLVAQDLRYASVQKIITITGCTL